MCVCVRDVRVWRELKDVQQRYPYDKGLVGVETCYCSVVVCSSRRVEGYATCVVCQGLVVITHTESLVGKFQW